MNTIIVGCGKVGQKLTEKLCQEDNQNITVVDLRANVIQDIINRHDVMGVVGSGSSINTLIEAGIAEADILIAVTGSDEQNLLTCLIAKKAGNVKTIARVRKPEYSKELHLFKEDLGLAMIINPEYTAANEIARLLRFPSAIKIDTFAKGKVEILKFKLPEGSPLDDMKIADISLKLNCDVLVCGVERGESAFIPDGNFVLRAGDLISIVAAPQKGSYFFKKIGIKTNRVKDTTIIGGGDTGFYLANRLLQTGIHVKIIEQNPKRCEELCELLPKAVVINGDGTDKRLLLEEGIEYAESVVSLMNIDEENILLSLFAKSKTTGKLVTKINKIEYDDVINDLNLDTIIYPKNITAEYIVRFVRARMNTTSSKMETMHLILDGKAEAIEFRIREKSLVTDIPIEKLKIKKNVLIACITRKGDIIIPRGHDTIMNGDTVIVVTTNTGLKQIEDILTN